MPTTLFFLLSNLQHSPLRLPHTVFVEMDALLCSLLLISKNIQDNKTVFDSEGQRSTHIKILWNHVNLHSGSTNAQLHNSNAWLLLISWLHVMWTSYTLITWLLQRAHEAIWQLNKIAIVGGKEFCKFWNSKFPYSFLNTLQWKRFIFVIKWIMLRVKVELKGLYSVVALAFKPRGNTFDWTSRFNE